MKRAAGLFCMAVFGLMAMSSCANANKTGDAEAAAAADTIPPVTQEIPGTNTDTLQHPDAEPAKP